ncbi:MAG: hypothetical protein EAZ27_13870, partial [Cytophagales bacterium]
TNINSDIYILNRSYKRYELKDHLGNVRVTVSDSKRVSFVSETLVFSADIKTYTDYYAFGMEMVSRNWSEGDAYRQGYNGKENDKDFGEGVQDYGFRIYDNQIGKFLSVDPLDDEFPWNAVYAFAENDVIQCIDLEGAEKLDRKDTKSQESLQRIKDLTPPTKTRKGSKDVLNSFVDTVHDRWFTCQSWENYGKSWVTTEGWKDGFFGAIIDPYGYAEKWEKTRETTIKAIEDGKGAEIVGSTLALATEMVVSQKIGAKSAKKGGKPKDIVEDVPKTTDNLVTVWHYTDKDGYNGIGANNKLWEFRASNPTNKNHNTGIYVTKKPPEVIDQKNHAKKIGITGEKKEYYFGLKISEESLIIESESRSIYKLPLDKNNKFFAPIENQVNKGEMPKKR